MKAARVICLITIIALLLLLSTATVCALYGCEEVINSQSRDAIGEGIENNSDIGENVKSITEDEMSLLSTDGLVTYEISKEQTYSFENIGNVSYDISGLNNYIDYVLYFADGSVSKYNFNQRPDTLTIPKGGKAVITSTQETVKAAVIDDYFIVEEVVSPSLWHVTVRTGETYEFVNNGAIAYNWLTCNQNNTGYHYDYVVYEADGTVKDYELGVRYSNISVPAGGKIVVTSIGVSGTECTAIFDKFTMNKKDTPAMHRANMVSGETYEFVNNGVVAYDWLTCNQNNTGYHYDYVVYEADGTVKDYELGARYSNISVPAGGKIVVTSIGVSGTECTAIFDKFTMTKKDTPAMHRANMVSGETYEFVNNGAIAYNWLTCNQNNIGYHYDYVVYEADGTVKNYELGVRCSNISVPAGGKIVVTSIGVYGTECTAIFDKFTMTKKDTPAMHRANMVSGETYEFVNNGAIAYNWLTCNQNNIGYHYDYVVYEADGTVKNYELGVRYSNISVPAGGKIVVTSIGVYGTECTAIFDKFTMTKKDTPAMHRANMASGETYEFVNNGAIAYDWLTCNQNNIGYHYDYVVYKADGTVKNYELGVRYSNISVPAGGKIVVTSIGVYGTECTAIFDKFTMTDLTDNTDIIEFNYNDTYKVSNIVDTDVEFSCNATYDYVIFGTDDSIVSSGIDCRTKITIPVGYYAFIQHSQFCDTALLKNENFSYEKLDDIAIIRKVLQKDESYELLNNSDRILSIKTNGKKFGYILYNAEGTVEGYVHNSTSKSIDISAKGKIRLTAKEQGLSFGAIASQFTVNGFDKSAFNYKILHRNETYIFKNNSTRAYTLYTNSKLFDYVIYSGENLVTSYGVRTTAKSFEIEAGSYIKITPRDSIEVSYLSDYFTEETCDITAFNNICLDSGDTAIFSNETDKKYKLFINSGVFDYLIYDENGNIVKSGINQSFSSINIQSGYKMIITSISNRTNIEAINDGFTYKQRSFPAMFRSYLKQWDESCFINNCDNDTIIYTSQQVVNYVIYDESENIYASREYASFSNLTIPSNGKIDIAVKSANLLFAGPYECFSAEDLTVKVTGITLSSNNLVLAKGKQSVLRATVLPDDATNKNIVWSSSDTSVATVAQTGKVAAKAVGIAIITVTTEDGGYTANCKVTVTDETSATVSVTGVALNKTTTTMMIGETESLTVTIYPSNATNKAITWKSSDTNIATVSSNGVVTAKAEGLVVITATTEDGNKEAVCIVQVKAPQSIISTFSYQVIQNYILVDIAVNNIPNNSDVYFATYNSKGKMLEIQKPVLTDGATKIVVPKDDINTIKAFVFNNLINPMSLYVEKEIK